MIAEITSRLQWEKFWESYGANALFQSWLWGDVLAARREKMWRLGLFEESTLVGIALVTLVSAKRGRFLHVRHGPILKDGKKIWEVMLNHLRKMATEEHVWFIRVSPLVKDLPSDLGFVPSPIHAMDAEVCWVLDLDASEEELLTNMRKTTRYEIRRAQKLGVTIEKSTNLKDISFFRELYKETSTRHGFVPHTGIEEEFKIFIRQNNALLFLGEYQGHVLAATIILFSGKQAIYHHSASIPSHVPVNYLLQWEAIKEAKKRGMKVYNFWGIAPENKPNHPWAGLTLFKKGFGGREVEYIHSQDLPVSPFYVIPRTLESIRRFVKGY